MKHSRLHTALDEGLVLDGTLHVIRPPAGYDLAGLTNVTVMATFLPDHAYWTARGLIGDGAGRAGTLVVLPRSKTLARQMILDAIDAGGIVVVDGQKTDGVESLYKDLRKYNAVNGVVTKGHGRLFWFTAGPTPAAWDKPLKSPEGFKTVPGVFSEGKVDAGSALLASHIDALKGEVADLGAGWGYLSRHILSFETVTHLDMIEAEKTALDCADINVNDARATAIWGDALTHSGSYDAVVSNPPFHTRRAGDPDLGRGFIATAARILRPRGVFYMVANRHLPYEADLTAKFGHVEELDGSGAFKVFRTTRPKR